METVISVMDLGYVLRPYTIIIMYLHAHGPTIPVTDKVCVLHWLVGGGGGGIVTRKGLGVIGTVIQKRLQGTVWNLNQVQIPFHSKVIKLYWNM